MVLVFEPCSRGIGVELIGPLSHVWNDIWKHGASQFVETTGTVGYFGSLGIPFDVPRCPTAVPPFSDGKLGR
jgi:hypothetical protein